MSEFNCARPLGPEALLEQRCARLERLLNRPLILPVHAQHGDGLPSERRNFLREEAEELYWNELAWDKLTADDVDLGGSVVELTFPGFLAFIEGLLPRGRRDPMSAPLRRTEVVEDILLFLAHRCVELSAQKGARALPEREITEQLVDQVLYRLYDFPLDDIERLETARLAGDE